MTTRSRLIALAYVATAALALVGMWHQIAKFAVTHGLDVPLFLRLISDTPAVTMLSIEMLCMALASSLFMYFEAEHLGWKHRVWLLGAALALGFGIIFPLFLAIRTWRTPSPPAVGQ